MPPIFLKLQCVTDDEMVGGGGERGERVRERETGRQRDRQTARQRDRLTETETKN